MTKAARETVRVTPEQAAHALASAVAIVMGGVLSYLDEKGVVEREAIKAHLRGTLAVHPDPLARNFAQQMLEAVSQSLDLSAASNNRPL